MVVIKVNQIPPGGSASLKSRAERAWKITPAKLMGQTKAVVMHKGIILEEYQILDYKQDVQEPDRIAFDLSVMPNSALKGHKVDYPTGYPCTVTDKLTLYV